MGCVVESHKGSRIEFMIKARSNFKRQSTANSVEIIIPVPADADSPKFKMGIGKVEYVAEKSHFVWKIKQFVGQKEYIVGRTSGCPLSPRRSVRQSKTPSEWPLKFLTSP